MARFRLSRPAQADLTQMLATSAVRWGIDGRRRYAAILAAALRQLAVEPEGAATRDRSELPPGVRSLHLRHARGPDPEATVRQPVHILYYRVVTPGLIEIHRMLHERMEPSRQMGAGPEDKD